MQFRLRLLPVVLAAAFIPTGCAMIKNFRAPALPPVKNVVWQGECGSCHIAFHPGLLPARSWHEMMGDLQHHFGENATVADDVNQEIAAFLVANAADVAPSRRSTKIMRDIPVSATPLRITEVEYVKDKHEDIKTAVFERPKVKSRANCGACHPDADKGDFDDFTVEIPK